ncbi:MAG: CPBP family intramembrane metalloprotease [Acidobacteria bacterium]|nr:CPBP family intramembrane metalloprotease [Acidobacteriota bacterium]
MREAFNPDDPPWGAGSALMVWVASILLMVFVPLFLVIPYMLYRVGAANFATSLEGLAKDPSIILVSIAATVPTHLLTLLLVWAVVTRYGRRPFWPVIGWSWGPRFGFWACLAAAILLLGGAVAVAKLLGVSRTPFDDILESSPYALFAVAFLATATAPLVEELVYRGVLYSALRRAVGVAGAVLLVTFLFALVHFWQYQTSPGTIGAILLLSLALTIVRASTKRVLPCVVIHFIFNGVQVAGLLYTYFRPDKPAGETQAALSALFRSIF